MLNLIALDRRSFREVSKPAAGDPGLLRVCQNLNLPYPAKHLRTDKLQRLSVALDCSGCEAIEVQFRQFSQSTCSAELAVQVLALLGLHPFGDAHTKLWSDQGYLHQQFLAHRYTLSGQICV